MVVGSSDPAISGCLADNYHYLDIEGNEEVETARNILITDGAQEANGTPKRLTPPIPPMASVHYIVDDSIARNLGYITHASDRVTVVVLGICIGHIDAVAGDVAAKELLQRTLVGNDDAVCESAVDS